MFKCYLRYLIIIRKFTNVLASSDHHHQLINVYTIYIFERIFIIQILFLFCVLDFDDAIPTKTHMAILGLQQRGIVKYVVSQNIDGLHLRSGYPRFILQLFFFCLFILVFPRQPLRLFLMLNDKSCLMSFL